MKTIYLVIGLNENTLLNSASLSSNGIQEESKIYVIGTLLHSTEDLAEAIGTCQQEAKHYELGCEIKTVYQT